MPSAMVIVDFQNDFTPGGALPVPEGDSIAGALNRVAAEHEHVIATRDWHPPDHGSFEGIEIDEERWDGTEPPNIWPPHCIAETEGAELHPALDRSRVDETFDKGQDPHSQGYSGFQGTNLARQLRRRGIDHLVVGGLATDYCVKNTVLDALSQDFEVTVVEDAVRGVDVDEGDSQRALEEMRDAGARVTTSESLLAEAGA
jgi:nicotinamidase/pyrazinamidase